MSAFLCCTNPFFRDLAVYQKLSPASSHWFLFRPWAWEVMDWLDSNILNYKLQIRLPPRNLTVVPHLHLTIQHVQKLTLKRTQFSAHLHFTAADHYPKIKKRGAKIARGDFTVPAVSYLTVARLASGIRSSLQESHCPWTV